MGKSGPYPGVFIVIHDHSLPFMSRVIGYRQQRTLATTGVSAGRGHEHNDNENGHASHDYLSLAA